MIPRRFGNKAASEKGQPKFKNTKIEFDGEKFDSKGEMERWFDLRAMQKAGLITDLHRQVPFELAPAVVLDDRKKPAVKLVVDFAYLKDGDLVVEDFKSPITAEDSTFRLKRHLLKSVWGLDVNIIMKSKGRNRAVKPGNVA